MAIFNPDVPDSNAPSFLGYSKPIDQPHANTTAGTALKGIADTLQAGIKGADDAIKIGLQDKIYAMADIQRQTYTDQLQRDKENLQQGGPLNILPSDGADASVPQGLQNLDTSVGNLTAARGANKISNTDYWGRLTELSKNLRMQYPGYRDYIDQTISQVVGANPANQLVRSLVGDINSLSQGKDQLKNKLISEIFTHGGEIGAPELLKDVVEGRVSPTDGFARLSKITSWKVNAARRDAQYKEYGQDKELAADKAGRELDTSAASVIANKLDALAINIQGVDGKDGNQKFTSFVQDVLSGKTSVSQDQARQMGQVLIAHRQEAYNAAYQELLRPVTLSDGTTTNRLNLLGGPEKAKTRLDTYFASTYDQTATLLSNGDFGAAHMIKKSNEDLIEDSTRQFVQNNPKISTQIAVGRKLVGDSAVKDIVTSMFGTDIPKEMKTYWSQNTFKLLTQNRTVKTAPDGSYNTTPDDKPVTINEQVDDMRNKGIIKPDMTPAEKSTAGKLIQGYLGQIDRLAKPTSPTNPDTLKRNIATAAYSRENWPMLEQFANDNGGQHSTFLRFTNPAVTKEMRRLSSTDQRSWEDYRKWTDFSLRTVFRNDFLELNKLPEQGVKIFWNPETHQWSSPEFDYSKKTPGLTDPFQVVSKSGLHVRNVNQVLSNVTEQLRAQGATDDAINAHIYRLFSDAGLQDGTVAHGMFKGLVGGQDAQKASQKPTEPRTEGIPGSPRGSEGQNTGVTNFAPENIFDPNVASIFARFDKPNYPNQLILDRNTGKYIPEEEYRKKYEAPPKKIQDRAPAKKK